MRVAAKGVLAVLALWALAALAGGMDTGGLKSGGAQVNGATITPAVDKADVIDAGVALINGQFQVLGGSYFGTTAGINLTASTGRITWTNAGRYIDVNESAGNLRLTSLGIQIGNNVVDTATAPTLTGGCTSPSVTWNTGSAAFQFDVGSNCTGIKTITVTLPTAANGWGCSCIDTGAVTNVRQSGGSTTTAVITNYGTTVATATDWTAGADIRCMCRGG